MPWQQLTLRIGASELAHMEALLRLAGATSVAISDNADEPLLEPAPGTTPMWSQLTVRAIFEDESDLSVINNVLGADDKSALEVESLSDADLVRAAQQTVPVLAIGSRLNVVPAEDFDADDESAVGLHMGLAFGTGQHPTTHLCLEWTHDNDVRDTRVLDYGCGTGVLALAALKLGAREAVAIDNEEQALAATRRNAALNQCETRLVAGAPESLDGNGSFDLILANILAQPLTALAAAFAGMQPPGGRLVLSGILVSQLDDIAAHYSRWYDEVERRERGEWALFSGRRRSGYDR